MCWRHVDRGPRIDLYELAAGVIPPRQVERPGVNVQMVWIDVPSRRSAIADLAVFDGDGLAAFDGVDQGSRGIPAATVIARGALVGDDKIGRGVGTGEQLGGQGGAGQRERLGETQGHGKPAFGAVDQVPALPLALAFLIDGDSYFLQDHKVAIDGAFGASEFAGGVRDGQRTTLVEQTNQPLLPSQGATTHRC